MCVCGCVKGMSHVYIYVCTYTFQKTYKACTGHHASRSPHQELSADLAAKDEQDAAHELQEDGDQQKVGVGHLRLC